jgi:hypothetical protein
MMEDRLSALESEIDRLNVKLHQLAWKMDDMDKKILEEPSEASEVEIYDLRGKLVNFESELSLMSTRIGVINKLISSYQDPVIDLPDTNIISHSLWKRMWAVFGHGLVGNIILTTWIIAIIIILFRGT